MHTQTIATVETMSPDRRLRFRYLSLSYTQRLGLALELGLLRQEDEGTSDLEKFRKILDRAKIIGKQAALWEKTSALRGDPPIENPFK